MAWLINAQQLDKFRKNQKNVVVLDATWYLPTDGKDPKAEFRQAHIPGAKFFDLDAFHDQQTPLPHMLTRDVTLIRDKVSALGITHDHKIIFYDNSPLHSSCRALWMFRVFGHHTNQLYILDGGLNAWRLYDDKVEEGESKSTPKQYDVDYQAHFVRTLVQMKTNLHHPTEQVVDMRHPVRYAGGPEPRMRMRSGHIPGAYCFPFMTMFTADGNFKPIEKIRKQLFDLGLDLHYPITTMCGSGITAAILSFVLEVLNHPNHALYDGSWAEWGSENLFPGEESLKERPVERSVDKG